MTGSDAPDPSRSAVLLVDLQRDFLHPDGAYARGGVADAAMTALPARLAPLLDVARARGVLVASTRFTLVPGRDGAPIVAEHLRRLRPFLRPGDFAPGSWGQADDDSLGPVDASFEKVAYSAFAHTRLGWWLDKVGVHHLVVAGIVTNGGVASTVRDAHVRELGVTVLSDGCAAFDDEVHAATLTSLRSVADIATVRDLVSAWSGTP